MPKILVLVDPSSDSAAALATLADLVADGARSVRFAEVDVRASGPGSRFPALDARDAAAAYDAVVVGGAGAAAALGDAPLHDRVAAAFGDDAWATLQALGALGAILLPPAAGDESLALGARAAKVAEWVRHAKSHEAKPGAGHSHTHSH